MKKTFQKNTCALPISESDIKSRWADEGFSFGIFRDPPGQEWNGFVHDADEYVLVAEGTLSIDVGDETALCEPGDLVCIPRGVVHSLKTVSPSGSAWFYGYGHWRTS